MIRAVMNDGVDETTVDEVEGDEVVEQSADEQQTADAGLAGVGETHEAAVVNVPCCEPDDEDCSTVACVFVRQQPEFDGNVLQHESTGWLNGEQIFYGADYASRKYAIEDAVRAIVAKAAESSARSDKAAAKFTLEFLQSIETMEGDEGPAGEPSGWPSEEESADDKPEIDDAGIPLAGEGEIVGGSEQPTEVTPTTPQASEAPAEPTREQRIELNRRKNAQAAAIHEQRLSEVRQELADWAVECSQTAVVAKQAKARLKEVTEEYERLLNRGPEVLPLFDGVAVATSGNATHAAVTATLTLGGEPIPVVVGESNNTDHPQASTSDPAPATADWRSRPTTELDLPPKLIEKLSDNGIETIGALEDQRAAFKGLRGIKGIGEAKADAIEDAVLAWLSKNRDAGVVVG